MPELVELVSKSPLGHVLLLKMVEIVVVSDNHGFVRIRHRCRGDGAEIDMENLLHTSL